MHTLLTGLLLIGLAPILFTVLFAVWTAAFVAGKDIKDGFRQAPRILGVPEWGWALAIGAVYVTLRLLS